MGHLMETDEQHLLESFIVVPETIHIPNDGTPNGSIGGSQKRTGGGFGHIQPGRILAPHHDAHISGGALRDVDAGDGQNIA